ncbi:hypothetical protein GOP47_0002438 [Adiantum capillus-veneris]|uniref:NAD-dependent epimerase/dehydratase domain-containing protein n=1 Tax=Adiantum capillus-veneris TaxID=13818 RepID=A0A9D4VA46_ADICA|nr:hypothetical protein GOP47_0002438 [Adiantum capillus-veneris]
MGLRKLNVGRPAFSHRATAQEDDVICVTGSWSFLGSWIVKLLLQHGYRVKSTIPHSQEDIRLLRSLPQAAMKLELADVDLLDYGSLSDLFVGCTGVFHVPAPNYDINGTHDYPVEIIDNEVRGVLNVVEACANTSSVRKLVLTSCLSSVLWDRQYYSSGVVLDERNWSDLDFCRKEKMWAAVSKTQAERAAWALARDRGLDLVVMNPAVVAGPKHVRACMSSSMLDQSGIFALVHVDDLAAAHVLAFEAEQAAGRYICFEKLLSKSDILEAAREMYPNHPIDKRLESFNPCVLSNDKLKHLGMNFGQGILEVEA